MTHYLTVNSKTLRADAERHARSNGLEESLARARRMVKMTPMPGG
jgi:hypothetical protein